MNQCPTIIVGVIFTLGLIVGLCVGLWPCRNGFVGQGVGNCHDIDECKERGFFDIFMSSPTLL